MGDERFDVWRGLAGLDRGMGGAGGEWSESGSSGYDSDGRNEPPYTFPAPDNGLRSWETRVDMTVYERGRGCGLGD
jgi:hypothetical protein